MRFRYYAGSGKLERIVMYFDLRDLLIHFSASFASLSGSHQAESGGLHYRAKNFRLGRAEVQLAGQPMTHHNTGKP